jgi:hypothetical protein
MAVNAAQDCVRALAEGGAPREIAAIPITRKRKRQSFAPARIDRVRVVTTRTGFEGE